jgi:hypothetical protein
MGNFFLNRFDFGFIDNIETLDIENNTGVT